MESLAQTGQDGPVASSGRRRLAFAFCALVAAPAAAEDPFRGGAPAASLEERIGRAIDRGVAWLEKRQDEHGSWGDLDSGGKTYDGKTEGYDVPFGPTALALYALSKSGVSKDASSVKRGFAWLKRSSLDRDGNSYEVAAALLAVTARADMPETKPGEAPKPRLTGSWRTYAKDLHRRLLARQGPRGWRYWGKHDTGLGGPEDVSSTQFALLALLSADACGIEAPATAWSSALSWTRTQQEPEGPPHPRAVHSPGAPPDAKDRARGFAYIWREAPTEDGKRATGAMTACGVATLLMGRHVLSSRYPQTWREFNAVALQQAIYDGLAWMDRRWSPFRNPESGHWHVYYLYCVERAMDLAGVHRLGSHLWYPEMAEELLSRQQGDGSWNSQSAQAHSPVLDTAFALLFLRRATRGGIPFPSVTGEPAEATDAR
jgi:hypothetical protein